MVAKIDDRQIGQGERAAGSILILAGAVTVVGMLYHPSVGGRGMDAIREIANESVVANLVHAVMLVALGALVFGLSGLTARLGWGLPASRAAFIAYSLAAVAMMGAAIINGFAINKVARAFLATGSQDLDVIRSAVAVLGAMSSTWAQVAVAAQAIALALWAVPLRTRDRGLALGAVLAALPAAAAGFGVLPLSVHGYLVVVVAQAVWTIWVGVQLVRSRL